MRRFRSRAFIAVLATSFLAVACGPGECGEFTVNLPSLAGSFEGAETCSETYGTFADARVGSIELFLQPESEFSLITVSTVTLNVEQLSAGQSLSIENGKVGGGSAMRWSDDEQTFVDMAGLTYGHLEIEAAEGEDARGQPLFAATWDFRWGDTTSPSAVWYRHAASDTIAIH